MGHKGRVTGRAMGRFWDERAREDAFYFVDSSHAYRHPDQARFWARGSERLNEPLGAVGATLHGDETAVDLGCGIGRLTRALADRVPAVHGFDVSAEMLRRARSLNPEHANITWHHGDGTTLRPLRSASVDAAISNVVFQHIPDPAITLGYVREIGRVLRPGGWAAFQISNDPGLHDTRHRPPSRLRVALRRAPKGQRDPRWLGSAIDLGALEQVAADAGMDVAQVAGRGTQYCHVRTVRR
ncbi:MAG: class I SAM-dependent methyltransferase [Solirubrobacterales bacterium]